LGFGRGGFSVASETSHYAVKQEYGPLNRPVGGKSACAIALLLGPLLAGPAVAQRVLSPGNVAPGSPGLATPGIAAPFSGELLPQGSPIPRALPAAPPAVGPGQGALPPVAPGAVPAVNVGVNAVRIDGATAYSGPQTAGITAGLVGPATPLARIEAARAALLNLYRNDGFALTTVTATVDPRGVLRFVVTEGRITEVKLEGDIGPAGTQVLRFLNHLTQVRPIDNATLERWLLLAQDVPGVALRAVLRPSAAEPGALTLVAQVERQAIAGLLSIDNRAFRLTGTEEGLVLLDFNSFSEFGERTEATFYHTNGNTQNFGQVTSEAFIGGSGLRVRLYGGYGEANPSGFLRDVRYRGTTTVFGGSATYPLIRARQQTLNLAFYLDAIETKITTGDAGSGSLQTGRDSLRVARLGLDYALQDGLAGDDRPAINAVAVRLSQGIPSLGATGNGDPGATRAGERVDFTKLVLDASRVQTLFRPWDDATVALKGRVIGQVSGQVLPPSEKFFLGGAEFNRGFYAGEVTGDRALVWQLELQLNTTYDVQAFGRSLNLAAQFYAFYDRGETWEKQAADANARLSSMGLGLRLNVTKYTEFDVEGVHRNTRQVRSGANVSPLKADAAYWRVITRF